MKLFETKEIAIETTGDGRKRLMIIVRDTGEIIQSDETLNYAQGNDDVNCLYSYRRVIEKAITLVKEA